MDKETLKSLDVVVEYLWIDELHDWREQGKPEKGHIYNDLYRLAEFIKSSKEKKTYAFLTSKSFRIETKAYNPFEAYALIKRSEENRTPESGIVTQSYVFDFWGSIADKEKLELAEEAKKRGVYSSHYHAIKDWCEAQAKQTVPNIIKGKAHASAIMNPHKEYTTNAWLKNVVETVKILIKPTAYDVLACLNPLTEDNFKDFCDEYGYNLDSINALKTFEACKEQDRQLHKLFTHDELEKLSEIQ